MAMDEISLTQKFVNLFLFMGGMFVLFYLVIYGVLRLGVAVLSMLVHQPDDNDASFDGDGVN